MKLSTFVAIAAVIGCPLMQIPKAIARPQWAYNMASHQCELMRDGTSKDEAENLTIDKYYKEYRSYIMEYGVSAWTSELFDQCPEFMSSSSNSNSNSNRSSNRSSSECSLKSSQIYDISRGAKVVVAGKNCSISFN